MARVDTADMLSVTEAAKLGLSRLIRDAEAGQEHVLLRNNQPVAAVVSISRLDEWESLEDDLLDVALAAARALTTGDERHSLDDVLARFGYTREQLRALDD
jgi:antitoxin (DNA-binding transcriptional repressor) of toxin-antitoxin stability system